MVARVALGLILSSVLIVSGVAAENSGPGPDEDAIRKAVESYAAAYNRGDASSAAGHWSREGCYQTREGECAKGPKAIRPILEKFFAENKGLQVKAALFDVQRPSNDKAVAHGFSVFQRAADEKDELKFTAEFVKEDGAWKLSKVQEDDSSVPLTTVAKLGELEWLIGDWVDQDEGVTIETSYRWTKDYAFIKGSFRVIIGDRVDLEGSQVIGWDPAAKKIRSWIFDAKAGFGEGEWSRSGHRWTEKVKSTLNTGQRASSINIYTFIDPNSFKWRSVSREIDGELLPDVDEVTVTRKTARNAQAESAK